MDKCNPFIEENLTNCEKFLETFAVCTHFLLSVCLFFFCLVMVFYSLISPVSGDVLRNFFVLWTARRPVSVFVAKFFAA
jgi:hypothetical protein